MFYLILSIIIAQALMTVMGLSYNLIPKCQKVLACDFLYIGIAIPSSRQFIEDQRVKRDIIQSFWSAINAIKVGTKTYIIYSDERHDVINMIHNFSIRRPRKFRYFIQ